MSRSKLPLARRDEIIALAEEVAETHCPGQFIDPIQILQRKYITYSFGYYGNGFDGMLEHRRGRFHMYCNLDRVYNSTNPRARFTQGHELGHFFIDAHRNALLRGVPPHLSIADQVDPERVVEEEADLFASHFLMPPQRFELAFKEQEPGLNGIIGISKHFTVSCSSAALRVLAATSEPLAMAYWRNDKPPWTEVNNTFRTMGLVHVMKRADRLPPDCATSLAMADNPNAYSNPRSSVSVASSWFVGIHQGSALDILVHEEALRLGRFGVLTVIRPLAPNRRSS
jgi:Zn-dependent peptidase ImmA (M78 family)